MKIKTSVLILSFVFAVVLTASVSEKRKKGKSEETSTDSDSYIPLKDSHPDSQPVEQTNLSPATRDLDKPLAHSPMANPVSISTDLEPNQHRERDESIQDHF
jgi:hypothetical protein